MVTGDNENLTLQSTPFLDAMGQWIIYGIVFFMTAAVIYGMYRMFTMDTDDDDDEKDEK
jgi:p-aminobenzoyl-glutamate transporter AbgT